MTELGTLLAPTRGDLDGSSVVDVEIDRGILDGCFWFVERLRRETSSRIVTVIIEKVLEVSLEFFVLIRNIVDRHGLPAATENTITDVDELVAEVDTIRSQGYSIEDEERVTGVKSVAVPVADDENKAGNSAISIAGPKHRFSDERIEDELLPELRNAANVIELQYKHY